MLPNLTCVAQLALAILAWFSLSARVVGQSETRGLDAEIVHLGDTLITTWEQGTAEPSGVVYEITFAAESNVRELCLLITHFDVDSDWAIRINDLEVGRLAHGKVLREYLYPIPAGSLQAGTNRLSVQQIGGSDDDILIGATKLVLATQRDHLGVRRVRVAIRDAETGSPTPARVTVTGASAQPDGLVRLFDVEGPPAQEPGSALAPPAVRDGILYVTDQAWVEFGVPAGPHRIDASRGMEWSLATAPLAAEGSASLVLEIRREVDTAGYLACDSHIHTYEFSGHGDAMLVERLVTLAGEGVELAIATDHNHNIDYAPRQHELGLSEHYRSVVGNEVTTKVGHFNAFPLTVSDPVPRHDLTDWVPLVEDMRNRGARVVVLNHPRWPKIVTGPFGAQNYGLDRTSGAFSEGPAITFDAVEVVNATTQARDPLYSFVDWFALLNHGDRVMAVGTSDSHTVRDPVGQGRTYLRCTPEEDADPRCIDVAAACDAIRNGTSSIAHGIFVSVRVGESASMGGTVAMDGEPFSVDLRVASAAWVRPRRALVFVNGARVAEQAVVTRVDEPTDTVLHFEIPAPPNDAHLVCVVLGDGVRGRHWRTDATNDYTLGATNPVWLDADRDGVHTSPRALAERLLSSAADSSRLITLVHEFRAFDDAVAIQAVQLARERMVRGNHSVEQHRADLEAFAEGLGRAAVREFVRSAR